MSTCDGPPFMNRKITRLARAGKCAGLGSQRMRGTASSLPPGVAASSRAPSSIESQRQPEHAGQSQRTESAADPRKRARAVNDERGPKAGPNPIAGRAIRSVA